jgi:hypothetical protein
MASELAERLEAVTSSVQLVTSSAAAARARVVTWRDETLVSSKSHFQEHALQIAAEEEKILEAVKRAPSDVSVSAGLGMLVGQYLPESAHRSAEAWLEDRLSAMEKRCDELNEAVSCHPRTILLPRSCPQIRTFAHTLRGLDRPHGSLQA